MLELRQLLRSSYFQCQITFKSIPAQPNQPMPVPGMSGTSYNMESSEDRDFIPKKFENRRLSFFTSFKETE